MILKGGLLKQPGHPLHDRPVTVECEKGVIRALRPDVGGASGNSLDVSGLWILPGMIDMHVHLREPGLEHKETIASGTAAAVAGGFSSVACMANTRPVNDSGIVCQWIVERAKRAEECRVFPIGAVTRGLKGEELAEIGALAEAGAVALSDDGMPVMNAQVMRQAMTYAKGFGLPIISHAEDAHLVGRGCMHEGEVSEKLGLTGNPSAAEEIMIAREIALCRLTRAPLHIAHLTTAEGLRHIERAKHDGLPVTCEVSPHHLTLTHEAVGFYNTHCKMAPPLRTQEDVDALIRGVAQGTIDAFATDHAPHAEDEKQVEFDRAPFGVLGLQSAFALTYDLVRAKKITWERWLDAWTAAPAKILPTLHRNGLGRIAEGGPADLTMVDPESTWTMQPEHNRSKSNNSPFWGKTFQGEVALTLVEGEIRYDRTQRRPRT